MKIDSNMIPLREYMRLWLYDNANGYYASENNIGKNGDFYTSVSLSKFFGAAIARYILKLLDNGTLSLPLSIIEIGANNADLISDIAEFLSACSNEAFLESNFYIIEPIGTLRKKQKDKFNERITSRFSKDISILENINDLDSKGIENAFFISNEIFDSMPCDLIVNDKMLYISANNKDFEFRNIESSLAKFIDRYSINNAEVSLYWESFIDSIVALNIAKWAFLTFDYGEFNERDMNLRIYQRHKVYNFYECLQADGFSNFYKASDITYDVDFSLLQRIFKAKGIDSIFCLTQAKALIDECNILEMFELFAKNFNSQMQIRERAKLQGLIMPNAMGERFKAACFIKGIRSY